MTNLDAEYYKKLAEQCTKTQEEHKIISCGYPECHSYNEEDEEFCVCNHYEPDPHNYINEDQIKFLFRHLHEKIEKLQNTLDALLAKKT